MRPFLTHSARPAKVQFLLAFALCSSAIVAIQAEQSPLSVQDICPLMPGGATILRPNSCTNWVKCPSSPDTQDYEEGACVYGLYFNKDQGRCQSSDELVCPFESGTKNRCANKANNTFLPDTQRCNGYIYCKSGHEVRSTCPNDLVFHPQQLACVYPLEYTCPLPVEQKAANPLCLSVREGLLFANQNECAKYFVCNNSELIGQECADGLAFDYVLGQCVLQANVTCHPTAKRPEPTSTICGTKDKPRVGYYPDEESCSSYYVCTPQDDGPDRRPKHLKCQPGYYFDSTTWSCRDRLNVKCSLDRCDGMDNKYVNVAGDCTAYARCSKGVAVHRGTCQSNYYFDERTQGCTPQIINYVACAA